MKFLILKAVFSTCPIYKPGKIQIFKKIHLSKYFFSSHHHALQYMFVGLNHSLGLLGEFLE